MARGTFRNVPSSATTEFSRNTPKLTNPRLRFNKRCQNATLATRLYDCNLGLVSLTSLPPFGVASMLATVLHNGSVVKSAYFACPFQAIEWLVFQRVACVAEAFHVETLDGHILFSL